MQIQIVKFTWSPISIVVVRLKAECEQLQTIGTLCDNWPTLLGLPKLEISPCPNLCHLEVGVLYDYKHALIFYGGSI